MTGAVAPATALLRLGQRHESRHVALDDELAARRLDIWRGVAGAVRMQ